MQKDCAGDIREAYRADLDEAIGDQSALQVRALPCDELAYQLMRIRPGLVLIEERFDTDNHMKHMRYAQLGLGGFGSNAFA